MVMARVPVHAAWSRHGFLNRLRTLRSSSRCVTSCMLADRSLQAHASKLRIPSSRPKLNMQGQTGPGSGALRVSKSFAPRLPNEHVHQIDVVPPAQQVTQLQQPPRNRQHLGLPCRREHAAHCGSNGGHR